VDKRQYSQISFSNKSGISVLMGIMLDHDKYNVECGINHPQKRWKNVIYLRHFVA
jgi:hypothetical protein